MHYAVSTLHDPSGRIAGQTLSERRYRGRILGRSERKVLKLYRRILESRPSPGRVLHVIHSQPNQPVSD